MNTEQNQIDDQGRKDRLNDPDNDGRMTSLTQMGQTEFTANRKSDKA